jgi:prephenate dehydrogenase
VTGRGRADPAAAGTGTVGIIGLGLVGGSLARDLAAAGWRVLGTDADLGTLHAALDEGVIAGTFTTDGADAGAIPILVIATPVGAAAGVLHRLAVATAPDAIITDTGSTKRSIALAAAAAGVADRFVGAHPMAGDHRAGWAAARRGLFAGATTWLCPGGGTGAAPHAGAAVAASRAGAAVAAMWRAVGAVPRIIDAAAHDRLVGWASHLPQVAASALAAALADAGVERTALARGGRDTTRIAASSSALWGEILTDNAAEVGPALDALVAGLQAVRERIAAGDPASVAAFIERGARWAADPPSG